MSSPLHGTRLRAVIAASLRTAARSGESEEAPVAVLWADPDRAWEPVIRLLQEAVPILVLGEWADDPDSAQGPALWIRAALAAPDAVTLPAHLAVRDPEHPEKTPWVLYLPGIHRHELTDLTQIPAHLAPLADVAPRSSWWESPSTRTPWTPYAFLRSKHGARLDLAGDAATRQALLEVLPRLLDEDVEALRQQGRLDAARLHARVVPDAVRTLLDWINDPAATRTRLTPAEWRAFAHTGKTTYGIDPDKDTHLTAAARLGSRDGEWANVWRRFAEAPARYPGIHSALDQARPQTTLLDDDPHPDSWPSWNGEQEDVLRSALAALTTAGGHTDAHTRLTDLAAEHLPRRDSVWADLGHAPLAAAIGLLSELADRTTADITATGVAQAAAWYAESGHHIDDLALCALTSAIDGRDLDAIRAALHTVYDPWVDRNARAFQNLVRSGGYLGSTGLDVDPGTCVVYVDALRLDLAHRLTDRLPNLDVAVEHRLAAFPTLTPTGQPAVAPVDADLRAGWGAGQGFDAGDSHGRSLKGDVLRAALAASDVQLLDWSEGAGGDPSGIGWTQMNDIDSAGHATKGARFETVIDGLLDRVAARITGLLEAGWARVVVVTDHGFLYPARPATKVELPLAVTEGEASRKPRVARLREGAPEPGFPTVPWTWDPNIRMVSAPGAAAFEAGVRYEHGGLSPQECVIPVVTVIPRLSPVEQALARVTGVRWTGQRCRIDVVPPRRDVVVELRTHPGDAASAVADAKHVNEDGEVKFVVDEERAEFGAAVHVVVLDGAGAIVAQHPTQVGGDQ
ncbi:BREX-1 system phosphatase PglZ type B [Salana multivorans]